ncbi:hypothetical protein COO60DRAFT_1703206, partial [Scenedesmus sp. NREL 46B-D3]
MRGGGASILASLQVLVCSACFACEHSSLEGHHKMNDFLAEYGSVLRALVRNDKAQINMLSMLAEDNRGFAEGIVRLVEQHILTCPPPAKLPALYLVDSIIKNVGEPYKTIFSERLSEAVWSQPVALLRRSNQILQPIHMQHAQLQQQVAPVQHNTPQHIMQAGSGALPPVSPAHPSWVAQQQQSVVTAGGAGPRPRRSPASPAVPTQLDAMRGPPPPAAGRSNAGQQQVRKSGSPPMPASGQLTSSALSQLLSNLAGTGVLAKGGGGAAEDAAKVAKVKDFQPAFLKEAHPGVLHLLEQLSLKSRAKFRDVEFQRNKRRSAAAGAGTSRPWYLTVDTWIAGTLTTEDAVASNPFGDEAASGSEQEEEALEPEDPEQPCCAISGEPFEKFFDLDKEE